MRLGRAALDVMENMGSVGMGWNGPEGAAQAIHKRRPIHISSSQFCWKGLVWNGIGIYWNLLEWLEVVGDGWNMLEWLLRSVAHPRN